jgi:hypothetical protein
VNFQILMRLRVGAHNVIDEALVLRKAPSGAGAQAKPRVFSTRNVLRGSLTVTCPVELAAHIDDAFQLHVRAVEDGADDCVVVIELGVGRDDDPELWRRAVRLLGRCRNS